MSPGLGTRSHFSTSSRGICTLLLLLLLIPLSSFSSSSYPTHPPFSFLLITVFSYTFSLPLVLLTPLSSPLLFLFYPYNFLLSSSSFSSPSFIPSTLIHLFFFPLLLLFFFSCHFLLLLRYIFSLPPSHLLFSPPFLHLLFVFSLLFFSRLFSPSRFPSSSSFSCHSLFLLITSSRTPPPFTCSSFSYILSLSPHSSSSFSLLVTLFPCPPPPPFYSSLHFLPLFFLPLVFFSLFLSFSFASS